MKNCIKATWSGAERHPVYSQKPKNTVQWKYTWLILKFN